jgi:riboflavin transporter FmnP
VLTNELEKDARKGFGMNWNYRTRRRIGVLATLVIGLIAVVIGSFIAHQDKTTGTVIVTSGVAFMVVTTILLLRRNDQKD